uniref:Uncharacterized protein n=1 Tax=Heterorhabditis bacteriophora TaxID=37862 RepID=A0A1I7WLZ5_HETBA
MAETSEFFKDVLTCSFVVEYLLLQEVVEMLEKVIVGRREVCYWCIFCSATSQVVLRRSASTMAFSWLSSIAKRRPRPSATLRIFKALVSIRKSSKPMLSCAFDDGSFAKC